MTIPEKAKHQPDVDVCCQFEPRFRPGTKVPLPFREFLATTSTTDIVRYSGSGLTLDEVIAAQHEVARGLWETLEEENARRADNRVTTPEEYMAELSDTTIWEGRRLRAALRLTPGAYPQYQVTRFDGPADGPWCKFEVMQCRVGMGSVVVQGFGAEIGDAVRMAARQILGEKEFRTPDDQLVFEDGVLVKVVRASVVTGVDEPADDEEAEYAPDDDDDQDDAPAQRTTTGQTE